MPPYRQSSDNTPSFRSASWRREIPPTWQCFSERLTIIIMEIPFRRRVPRRLARPFDKLRVTRNRDDVVMVRVAVPRSAPPATIRYRLSPKQIVNSQQANQAL
ncbi:hypothetical protein RT717_15200 [Imperialibacter roseus]|uniref:Uncharacterized protein n=1 Tax=Imperialibacter roseus TaxID=1324217 RepID=A0ABZ0IID2_9BACT|nr:hypothetical protein [Imperialibacter roseus]WOK04426.1 hypothetical protein RT717_15200 [Imperialibacter roseus]